MNLPKKNIKYLFLFSVMVVFCNRYFKQKTPRNFDLELSHVETSRETLYNYFTDVESETIFKSNPSTEYTTQQ